MLHTYPAYILTSTGSVDHVVIIPTPNANGAVIAN